LTVSSGGQINTEAEVSNSGKIDIRANTIAVSDKDSSISAVNKTGHGNAKPEEAANVANIDVQGKTLTLSDGGNITSSTSGQNPAGTVTITMSDSKTAAGQDQKGHIDIYGQGSGIFSKAEKEKKKAEKEKKPEGNLEVTGQAGEIHLTSSEINLRKPNCDLDCVVLKLLPKELVPQELLVFRPLITSRFQGKKVVFSVPPVLVARRAKLLLPPK